MLVRVLGFDCIEVGDFEVESYTVYATGTMRLRFADGTERAFEHEEWIDIQHLT